MQAGLMASSWFLDQYGNLASVMGLVLSLVTLVVAWSARARIRTAEEHVLNKVKTLFYHGVLSDSVQFLKSSFEFCRRCEWDWALDRSRQSRESLGKVLSSGLLQPYQERILLELRNDLASFEGKLLRKKSNKNRDLQLLTALERTLTDLVKIESALFQSAMGATHRANALNVHYVRGACQGFREKISVQSGGLAFAGDAVFAGILLQKT